jgi:hypothetical protein
MNTPHAIHNTQYASRLTPHASHLTFHASHFTFHASRFTFHVSRFTLLTLLLTLLALHSTLPASAHGAGKMQLASAPAGPFLLTVWTGPDPARVGSLHISTAVAHAADNTPALEETVTIQLNALHDPTIRLHKTATTEDATNKFLYEADFLLPSAGSYEVIVSAHNQNNEGGAASFNLTVEQDSPFNWTLILLAAVALLSLAGVLWYARTTPKGSS